MQTRRLIVGAVLAGGLVAFAVGGVAADEDPDPGGPPVVGAPNVPVDITFTAESTGITKSPVQAGSFVPTALRTTPPADYPLVDPTWTDMTAAFMGLRLGLDADGTEYLLYCIQRGTPIRPGYGYNQAPWDPATMSNTGYIARLLANYYPNVSDQPAIPAGTTGDLNAARAAVVQAAIWYFSDYWVLDGAFTVGGQDLRATVASLVNEVLELGPVEEPDPPLLAIVPPTSTVGQVSVPLGPFTIDTNFPTGVTLTVTGAASLTDASGAALPDAVLLDGETFYLLATAEGAVTVTGTALGPVVPSGNVFVYANNVPNVETAQRLILASTEQAEGAVEATASFGPAPTTTTTTTTTVAPTTTTVAPTTTAFDSGGLDPTTTVTNFLPATGSGSMSPIGPALAAVVLGVVIVALSRRRHQV